MNRLRHAALTLAVETGIGLTTGQGSDPQIMLRWSDDGGHTWSNEHWLSMGPEGDFDRRMIWRKLGNSRGRIYEISGSDPVSIAISDAFVEVG